MEAELVASTGDILVVEDDAGIRQAVVECLEYEGYRVRQAANGTEAVERIASGGPPALVLLDLLMPAMNGRQLLRWLKTDERTSDVKVIVMTAATPSPSSPIPGADALLTKPFDLGDLLAHLQRLCGPPDAAAGEAAPG